ncbi:MAG TPA: DUF5665 domain-containing protein [Patescibacteria group bacterium]|jgi:hypothetical protein|nr:DUF5665 domain-containing protein [Patescibacteria group bacterium]
MPNLKDNLSKDAVKALAEELFEDYYKGRWRIYKLNLFRGIFFGLGTAIGGTIIIAVLVWSLSLFDQLPFVGDFVQTITNSVDLSRQK